jgi:tRNA threonylcarbamoyladenosine biosynthesis protein TsaE
MKILIEHLSDISKAAQEFLSLIGTHKVIAFSGEMGAGKTTFIKALCAELGIGDIASSPTYSLVNEYHSASGEKVYHFDFYRLNNETEALDMGCDEYFYSGSYCFIEWPEKIASLLPPQTLAVQILLQGEAREIVLTAL